MGKKKQQKKQKMDLNEFLSQSAPVQEQGSVALPTAPKAREVVEVPMCVAGVAAFRCTVCAMRSASSPCCSAHCSDSLPPYPPFKAFVGNLHFEVDEEILAEFFESKGCEVKEVTIVRNVAGVMKGFGYIEVGSRMDLKKALESTNTVRQPVWPCAAGACHGSVTRSDGFAGSARPGHPLRPG